MQSAGTLPEAAEHLTMFAKENPVISKIIHCCGVRLAFLRTLDV
jgi:hypothetical protein